VVVVSHDRAFLDATCPRTASWGSCASGSTPRRTASTSKLREEDIARERREVELQRQEIAKTEDFIRRNLAGQKTAMAKGRRKMLEKLVRLENPEDIWADARKLGLRFAPGKRSGDIVLEARGLGATRGGRSLFAGIDLLVRRGSASPSSGPTARARAPC
jgi:ATP-binding cassette subfamily F protein 3